jgi:hypothetical protein
MDTSSVTQTTESLLTQLMSEMKYLRDRVTLPTGTQTGLQTSHDFREPSSQSSSSVEEMEVIEQTELPCFPQVTVTVQPLEISTSANLQVSEIAHIRALVRKHDCPLPLESPSLSQPKFMLFGAQAPPRPEDPCLSAKALAALPSSTVAKYFAMHFVNHDSATGSVRHQRMSITTLDSCGPGAWTMAGKLFTPTLPAVDKYKPEYYWLDTSSCGRDVSSSVLWGMRQISSIASNWRMRIA